DAHDRIRATGQGAALIVVTRLDTDGRLVQAVQAINTQRAPEAAGAIAWDEESHTGRANPLPDVYPGTLTLLPGAPRQLKVHLIDPDTGESTNIHTAHQIVFAGTPEEIETFKDPTTQVPLIDPLTGEIVIDADTGEIVLDPDSGETITFVIPAVPEARSGTRYLISDDTIATVSDDGLITARRAGRTTLSIIHLATRVDTDGQILEQTIGQTDILLTVTLPTAVDDEASTATPAAIVVVAEHGGIVRAASGETVLIGAGALKADTAVGIRRVALADLVATTGMAPPVPRLLSAIGAFSLDLGADPAVQPLQFAIPVQDGLPATPGEEIWFLRKGTLPLADGSFQDTWWLADNGYIGADGIARTASTPYPGLNRSGDYLVCRAIVSQGAPAAVNAASNSWISFAGESLSMSGSLASALSGTSLLGYLLSEAIGITVGDYAFGVPRSLAIPLPSVSADGRVRLDLGEWLAPARTPWGHVALPNISAARVTDDGQISLTINNPDPGAFAGRLIVRVLFPNGSARDVLTLDGKARGVVNLSPPAGIAVGSVRWQIVRQISSAQLDGTGGFTEGEMLEFAGNTLRIAPQPHMAAVLTRNGLTVLRENLAIRDIPLPVDLPLLESIGQNDLGGGVNSLYRKVQPIAFSTDLARAYVAGNGVVYCIDLVTLQRIDTIALPSGRNLRSLAIVGNQLLLAEGGETPGARLLLLDIAPGSAGYHTHLLSLRWPGGDAITGFAGIAVGRDARTLVVSAPKGGILPALWSDRREQGDILVFDLSSLNPKTGAIAAPLVPALPASGLRTPLIVSATDNPDRYLVSAPNSLRAGLATLQLTRNEAGQARLATLNTIPLIQGSENVRYDVLDLQRAQSAVWVKYKGVDYAIVADDNYGMLDPFYNDMERGPEFVQTGPSSGSWIVPKPVAVGGKLGLVRDPFGTPQYLGATVPLDGYGIQNLALSEDGRVLIGQLEGRFGSILTGALKQPHGLTAWSVYDLIEAALALPEKDRLSKHIPLPAMGEQTIPVANVMPLGTAFDPEFIDIAVTGKLGDIIGVDLSELAAKQLLLKDNKISPVEAQTPLKALNDAAQRLVKRRMATLGNFSLQGYDLQRLASRESALQVIMTSPASPTIYSRSGVDSLVEDAFEKTGVLFFARQLTEEGENNDLEKLRSGKTLSDKWASFLFTCTDYSKDEPDSLVGSALVTAKDFASTANVYFGDRPLDDPGYSKFELRGSVGISADNDRLDVYRVEQRLKYLGYNAYDPTKASASITEFAVDGIFGDPERRALQLLEKIVRYGTGPTTGEAKAKGKASNNWATAEVTVNIRYNAEDGSYSEHVLVGEPKYSLKAAGKALEADARNATITTTIEVATRSAIEKAKLEAKADFDKQIAQTWVFEPAKFSADGLIESPSAQAEGAKTLGWLNAYNAPHWMRFAGEQLAQGWVYVGESQRTDMTSWVRDLMIASATSAELQKRPEKLVFQGGGELGSLLNLGINPKYVSKVYQDSLYGDEWLLGLVDPKSIDLDKETANKEGTALQKLKYAITELKAPKEKRAGTWNAQDAEKLANLLDFVNRVAPPSGKQNNQKEALKDFQVVYGATQDDGQAGNGIGWDDIKIASAGDKDRIKVALFGTGTSVNGLIDNNELFLGGVGAYGGGVGAKLDTKSLSAIMGDSKRVDYADWVYPINIAMARFNINTPKRVAAFLANVYKESAQLEKTAENTDWTLSDPRQRIGRFKSASAAILTEYANRSADDKADYAYGNRPDRGNTEWTDGHKYKGRGIIHLTWKNNYKAANDALNSIYGSGAFDLLNNYESVSGDKSISALSGAFFWQSTTTTATGKNLNLVADADDFRGTVKGVNGGGVSLKEIDNRTGIWKKVNKFIYDQNAYGNMGELVSALGIHAIQKAGYNTKFGINLGSRAAQIILSSSTSKLISDENSKGSVATLSDSLDAKASQDLVTDFNVELGGFDMLFVSAIDSLQNPSQPMLVAHATPVPASAGNAKLYGTVGVCYPASNVKGEISSLGPADVAELAFATKQLPLYVNDYAAFAEAMQKSTVEVTKQPEYGLLMAVGIGDPAYAGPNSYRYMPKSNYIGADRVDFLVVFGKNKVKIIYFIKVIGTEITTYNHGAIYKKYCPKSSEWVISSVPSEFDSWFQHERKLDLDFADLRGYCVGETTESDASAHITLDTDAAGYGWFIDPTPSDHEEFLPTSDPHEWIAKPGNDAAGKMDLVTVLLHEYGHAQGLDHSVYAHDLMATTLLPGVRRLPSESEWATLRGLLTSAGGAPVPQDPFRPPGAPLPVSRSLGGALRSARQPVLGLGGADRAGLTQYDTAANLTLTNPEFANGTAWSTTGDVTFAPGAATLKETPTSQTRLSQAFVLGPDDRYLTFTLSAIALDDVDNAPDDAFEVALIDANTGLSLLGGTGLTHNDAFLNLQADGSETKSSGVTTIRNPDGSRSVLVDLAGVHANAPAGTVVNLSFDLIGFGRGTAAVSSRVTVKDLHLGLPQEGPQARDDSATTAEDTPIDLDVAANDTVTSPAHSPSTPILVSGPAHGSVELTAQGRLRYTPAADWSGEDQFTYRLANDSGESNIATVTLTVTPVNDAPVLTDQDLSGFEDTPLAGSLLTTASDTEAAPLTATLISGPAHGTLVVNPDFSFTYTPDANWNGSDRFSYRVSDGELDSPLATVHLTVAPVNDAPVIAPQRVTVDEDTPVPVDLLAAASDVDGDTLTVTLTTAPQHGRFTQNADGTWTYVPTTDWNGQDSASFDLSDGTLSTSAQIEFTVTPVNDAPVLADQDLSGFEDTPLAGSLLTTASDTEAAPLTATLISGPAHGTLVVNPDFSFTYTPDANWNGSDRFSYRVSDGELDSPLATVHLTVAPVNDAPVIAPQRVTVDEDTPVPVDLLAAASDVDGDTLTVTLTTAPQHGRFTQNADGTWTYVPTTDWNGQDSASFDLSDGT
ncbi:MAG: Ig-like domain-containing protein, partial [Candidatus Accumulibacter sp.]|uniref:tandem-95 repeat protein n=1 Tax=Accumulibacter sp. TaxID=2053492 RepID=UPI00287929C5